MNAAVCFWFFLSVYCFCLLQTYQRYQPKLSHYQNSDLIQLIFINIIISNLLMLPSQQKDDPSQPKKRIKKDFIQPQEEVANNLEHKLFCKCYSDHQINLLMTAIVGFQNYSKYISILIRHQEKSIETLPESLRKMGQFSELFSRVPKYIERARINNDFMSKIIKDYSQYLGESIEGHNISQYFDQITPNIVLHILTHVIKQWSQFMSENKNSVGKIINLIKEFSPFYPNKRFDNGNKPAIFIQGSGMSRIICELYQNLSPKPQFVEACQDKVLHYLCGEYFLSSMKKWEKDKFEQNMIFPFLHDFSNKFKTGDSYQYMMVPEWPYQSGICESQQIFVNLGTFESLYASNEFNDRWDILVSYLCSDKIQNVLKWIQIVYKGLKSQGIWLIYFYANFEKNVIPLTYQEFREILGKSQFVIKSESKEVENITLDRGMTKQKLLTHYIVLQK